MDVDDVALMPVTEPSSMSVDVPIVVAVIQRTAYPRAPPESEDASPRLEVATHLVVVPVV